MTTITSYDTLNSLPELSFIAGTDKVLTFTCYKEDQTTKLNLSSGPVYWKLCPFGSFTIETLYKTGVITGTGTFTITLTAAETLALRGKYIQQVIITDYYANTFRPAQGTVIILPAIDA
jgi:hypothetical protein